MNFGPFSVLTFDCYGTLVDWESGILESLRPVLERVYPMAELAEAHRVMEGNETFGKVVVSWTEAGGGAGGRR